MKAILLAGLLALVAISALSHSGLDTTAPENGAVLVEPPPRIVLTFAKRTRLTRVRLTHGDRAPGDLNLGDQKSFATRFVVPLTGEILTMPGLPRRPFAVGMDVAPDGTISGLA